MRPTYIGLGPPRTGTTSIHNALRYHPEIETARSKELRWFDKEEWEHNSRNLAKYQNNWQDITREIRGEITPNYILYPEKLLKVYPDIKYFISWRDPIERLISQISLDITWLERLEIRHDGVTLDQIDSMADRIKDKDTPGFALRYIEKFEQAVQNYNFWLYPAIDLGHTRLLSMWQKLLPPEQLQIIKFEELIDPRSQTEVINNLYRFLGAKTVINPQSLKESKFFNANKSRVSVTLGEKTIDILKEYYANP
jgi:hypothetical protein